MIYQRNCIQSPSKSPKILSFFKNQKRQLENESIKPLYFIKTNYGRLNEKKQKKSILIQASMCKKSPKYMNSKKENYSHQIFQGQKIETERSIKQEKMLDKLEKRLKNYIEVHKKNEYLKPNNLGAILGDYEKELKKLNLKKTNKKSLRLKSFNDKKNVIKVKCSSTQKNTNFGRKRSLDQLSTKGNFQSSLQNVKLEEILKKLKKMNSKKNDFSNYDEIGVQTEDQVFNRKKFSKVFKKFIEKNLKQNQDQNFNLNDLQAFYQANQIDFQSLDFESQRLLKIYNDSFQKQIIYDQIRKLLSNEKIFIEDYFQEAFENLFVQFQEENPDTSLDTSQFTMTQNESQRQLSQKFSKSSFNQDILKQYTQQEIAQLIFQSLIMKFINKMFKRNQLQLNEEDMTWDRRNTVQTEEIYQTNESLDFHEELNQQYFNSEPNFDEEPHMQYQSTRKSMRQTVSKNKPKPKGLLPEGKIEQNFASKINANKFFEGHKVNDGGIDDYNFYDDFQTPPQLDYGVQQYNPKRNRFNQFNQNQENAQNDYLSIYNSIQVKTQKKFTQKPPKQQNQPGKKINLFNQEQLEVKEQVQKKVINPNRKISLFENDVKQKFKTDSQAIKLQKITSKQNIPQMEEDKFNKAPEELEKEYHYKKQKLNKLQEDYRQLENDPRNLGFRKEQMNDYKQKIQKIKQENQNIKGEERIFDEDISKVRRDMIQLEMQISQIPYMNPYELDQKNQVINNITQLQKRIRKSKQNQGQEDLEEIRKRSKENLEQEFQEIQINIQNYDEDLLRWMTYYYNKFQLISQNIMINLQFIQSYDQKIKMYSEHSQYQYHFDLFYLEFVHPFFKQVTVSSFLEMMRYMSKIFLIGERELILIRMNLHLLNKNFQMFSKIILLDEIMSQFIKNQLMNDSKKVEIFFNLFFIFINAKIISQEENRFQTAQELNLFIQFKIIKNLPEIFNQWSVSNRYTSLSQFQINKQIKKMNDLKNKDFDYSKIFLNSDVPTRIDESLQSIKSSHQNDSYIDEIEFAPNEEFFNFIGAKEHQPNLFRMESHDSIDHTLNLMNFQRTFSNTSDIFFREKQLIFLKTFEFESNEGPCISLDYPERTL